MKFFMRILACFALVALMACAQGASGTSAKRDNDGGFLPVESRFSGSSAILGVTRKTMRSGNYEITLEFGQAVALTRTSSADGRYVIEGD